MLLQNEMFVVPFVRMEEHDWNSTLSLVQSKASVEVDAKNQHIVLAMTFGDHVVKNSFSSKNATRRTPTIAPTAECMPITMLLLLLVLWMKTRFLACTSRVHCRIEQMSPRGAVTAVPAVPAVPANRPRDPAVTPRWVPPAMSSSWKHSFSTRKEKSVVGGFDVPLPSCSLENIILQLVPASDSNDGFEWITLREGSSTNDCYGLEPEAPDHRRRGLFRLKNRTQFELDQLTFNIGNRRLSLKSPSELLPSLDENFASNFTAEVSGEVHNPKSTVVITQRMVDAMQREEHILKLQDEKYQKMMARELLLRAPKKKPRKDTIPERTMFLKPVRLVFDLVGDAPFAPRKMVKASSSNISFTTARVLDFAHLAAAEVKVLVQSSPFVPRKKRRIGEKEEHPAVPFTPLKIHDEIKCMPNAPPRNKAKADWCNLLCTKVLVFATPTNKKSTADFVPRKKRRIGEKEEEKQVPIPSAFEVQANEDEGESDDFTSEEDFVHVKEETVLPIPSAQFEMQAKKEDEIDDSNSAEEFIHVEDKNIQKYGSGFKIDKCGRVRRISNRRRSREVQQTAEDLVRVQEEPPVDENIAQIFGSGSEIDKCGRVRRISNRTRWREVNE